MDELIKLALYLFALLAMLAAAAMIAIAFSILYLYSMSLGKAAKFEWDDIFDLTIQVFFIQVLALTIGLLVLWFSTHTISGFLLTALGALLTALVWPISIFFMLDSPNYREMVLWATGSAFLVSQIYIVFRVVRKTQAKVEGTMSS